MEFFENEALEWPKGLRQARSESEWGVRPANRKHGLIFQPATAPAKMVHVK